MDVSLLMVDTVASINNDLCFLMDQSVIQSPAIDKA